MSREIIGLGILLVLWILCLISMGKREDTYLDWLANYNLPKEEQEDKKKKKK